MTKDFTPMIKLVEYTMVVLYQEARDEMDKMEEARSMAAYNKRKAAVRQVLRRMAFTIGMISRYMHMEYPARDAIIPPEILTLRDSMNSWHISTERRYNKIIKAWEKS